MIGPNSGGSFNPARSIAPAVLDGTWSSLWVYIVGPLAGGAVAGVVYSVMRDSEPGLLPLDDEVSEIRAV